VKKSTTYRQTFRRHRILLTLPIVIAVLIAGALTVTSAKTYESSASLWVDNPATTDSSLGNLNPAETPPSTQEQNVVTELLATQDFALKVAHRSSLASYLASHSGGGISSILGGGGSLDSRIIAALAPPAVTTSVPGPQVLQISYFGPTPAVAQSTLQALVDQVQKDSTAFSQQHTQGAIAFYTGQVDTASQALLAARNQADAYRAQHPSAQPGDPNLAAFQTAETSAGAELTQAQAGLSGAKAALKGGSAGSQVHLIDSATFPSGPTTGKKKQVEGILAGLVAGLLISFLGTLGLTRRESDPWEDELAEAAGSDLAAQPRAQSAFAYPHETQPYGFGTPVGSAGRNRAGEVPAGAGGPLASAVGRAGASE
jgi:uncharacterized protein involved in exopolysaccharide biosynthesis